LVDAIGPDGVLDEIETRLGRSLERAARAPSPPTGYEDLIGWFHQSDGDRWTAGLCPPLGRMSSLQLEGVAIATERYGKGRLRTTPEQGIMALDIREEARDAFAVHVAQFNLGVHSDSRTRNVVACTGKQFCNIAVTETKAHALQLIEKLRERSLELHGVRIHMSGCPSACANHHTADIGLKGVRVKRLLGTREGFDVYLGGGVAGSIQLGLPYKTGVDVGQLPQLVEEVVREYYLRHGHGETFSDYWRRQLRRRQAAAAKEEEFHPAVWECESCGHRHAGEDPPIYCPQCAALRRNFARLEDGDATSAAPSAAPSVVIDSEGFAEVADEAVVPADRGLMATVNGREIALFRVEGEIRALDAMCPHAGGSLAEGTVTDGVVTCPLHGWRFNTFDGAAIAPAKSCVTAYTVRVKGGKVYVQLQEALASSLSPAGRG
jgi:nitrite reductase/ring-hydroxylating ferredoxin subunit